MKHYGLNFPLKYTLSYPDRDKTIFYKSIIKPFSLLLLLYNNYFYAEDKSGVII